MYEGGEDSGRTMTGKKGNNKIETCGRYCRRTPCINRGELHDSPQIHG